MQVCKSQYAGHSKQVPVSKYKCASTGMSLPVFKYQACKYLVSSIIAASVTLFKLYNIIMIALS